MLNKNETKTDDETIINNKKNNIIVCWDFDWSLINENSDYYVHQKLYGKNEYTLKLYPELREKASCEGINVFTDFMDKYGWPKIFKEFNLNSKSFSLLVSDIPIFKENLKILNTINKYCNNNNDGIRNFDINQYIISNANQVLIDIILKKNNLNGNVFKSDQIFTNPGWYDNKTGILRCRRYHNFKISKNIININPHSCNICAANLCKGKVLNEQVLIRHNKPYTHNNIIIYIGDGGNDFCPISKLTKNDYVFCRQFKQCRGLEEKIKNQGDKLKCNVLKWKDGNQLLQNFKKVLPQLNFQ